MPRGTKPTATVNVASDDPKDDELIGAAGLFDGEEDFDPNVFRPDGESADKIFYAFQVLINERTNWDNADECSDHLTIAVG